MKIIPYFWNKIDKMVSVITGDIVNSSSLPKKEQNKIEECIRKVLEEYEDKSIFQESLNYIFYRGDSFQIVIKDSEKSFRLAMKIRLAVKKQFSENDVRMSIGIGKIENNTGQINQSTGEAFTLSGKALDEMDAHERIVFNAKNKELNQHINISLRLLEVIIKNWTQEMCEVVDMAMGNLSQKEMAKKIGVNQPAVSKRLKHANSKEYMEYIDYYEEVISKLT